MVEIVVPEDAWEGDTEGAVSVWFFEDGQAVQAGALIAELMFEKVAVELRAPVGGTLRIRTPAEVPVRRGDVLAVIE